MARLAHLNKSKDHVNIQRHMLEGGHWSILSRRKIEEVFAENLIFSMSLENLLTDEVNSMLRLKNKIS